MKLFAGESLIFCTLAKDPEGFFLCPVDVQMHGEEVVAVLVH